MRGAWPPLRQGSSTTEQKEKRGTITDVLKGQVLVVATTILIHIDAIDEYRTVFNNFIVFIIKALFNKIITIKVFFH